MTKLNQNGKPRDTQREKVYRSDRIARRAMPSPLLTVPEIERYLKKKVSGRATLVRRYGIAADFSRWEVAVGDGRGTRRALAHGTSKITIPLWARDEWVVLHEIAHIIHGRLDYQWHRSPMGVRTAIVGDRKEELKGGPWHGWQFCAVFLDLVQFCMGAEAAEVLKAAFKENNVRWRPKRVRVMPEGYVPFKKKVVVTDAHAMDAIEGRKAA